MPPFNTNEFEPIDVAVGENVRLRGVEHGPKNGPLVLLLHGFPASWASWRAQIRPLANAGFRVVAPDLRGYGASSRPQNPRAYETANLVADVVGLVHAMGAERAHIAGHDWGGIVAWWTAMLEPHAVERLAILNAPHPVAFAAALRRREQRKRSAYVFFFQVTGLAEWWLSRGDFAWIRAAFRPSAITDDDVNQYVRAIAAPGALTATLNYYRAAFREELLRRTPRARRIDHPTLVLWGDRDRFLGPELASPPPRWVANARVKHFPAAAHWVLADAPDDVSARLVEHFRGPAA